MASSWIEVANGALARLGAKTIMSFDDDNKEARLCKERYKPCRDIVLRMHLWNCATGRARLASDVSSPAFGWGRQFTLPHDCLRLVRIDGDIRYEIEGKKILSDETLLDIIYIKAIEDVTILDNLCAECISAYLAYDLANIMMQSPEFRENLKRQFDEFMRRSKTIDSQEQDIPSFILNHYEKSRNGSMIGGLW